MACGAPDRRAPRSSGVSDASAPGCRAASPSWTSTRSTIRAPRMRRVSGLPSAAQGDSRAHVLSRLLTCRRFILQGGKFAASHADFAPRARTSPVTGRCPPAPGTGAAAREPIRRRARSRGQGEAIEDYRWFAEPEWGAAKLANPSSPIRSRRAQHHGMKFRRYR